MDAAESLVVNGGSMFKGTISEQAWDHCSVAQSVKVGELCETKDGYVVRRVSQQDWEVVSAPVADSPYQAGRLVKGRVVFWKMNGLTSKRMAC
mgnify:CR=1 FL=1